MSFALESLKYKRGELTVIDQLKLPSELEYLPVRTAEDAWQVIRTMQVRGAPLIAIVAALGLAVHVNSERVSFSTVAAAKAFLLEKIEYLRTSRPTAVNLFVATDELRALVESSSSKDTVTVQSLTEDYILAAESMLSKDIATNKSIGRYGAEKIIEITGKDRVKVLTICNTGSLATAGYGTALGVIRSLREMGKLEHVYACETRPYNQGARLTAFEIVQDNLPGTLIADSMASYLMATSGVDCVVVGADRVAANGDTANKIGTYQLAIAAKYHNVPFFAAVPSTTFDVSIPNGSKIHVELRPAVELTSIFGTKIAPDGINAWNPSFDVTPCSLIRGIITELGVAETAPDAGSDGIIDIPSFLSRNGLAEKCTTAAKPSSSPSGYSKFDEKSIAAYLLQLPKLRRILGTETADNVEVKEVGDGNLNFVYILTGPSGVIVAKQALPYVRCVGESWPLTLERASFESNALNTQRNLCPDLVPEVFLFDKSKALIVMRFVEPPHLILRKVLVAGSRISTMSEHISTFLARTLFGTSALFLDGGSLRAKVSEWSRNSALCALTEQVIFTDPYHKVEINRWTTPQLDSFVTAIHSDEVLKLSIANLKAKFFGSTEALLHGDLHTGSIMAMEGSTFAIDPEFAFYGPMGFDVGLLLGNLFLAYFSQEGHRNGSDYADWLLGEIVTLYSMFEIKFIALWNEAGTGEAYRTGPFPLSSDVLKAAQQDYMQRLFADSIGFAGAEMIRRIVGIAHVADLESIENADVRSVCEKKSLVLARDLAVNSTSLRLKSIREVADRARELLCLDSPPASLF